MFKISVLAALSMVAFECAAQDWGKVTVAGDPRIERLLRLRMENNGGGRKMDGYVIQVYYGRMQKAREVLAQFQTAYPGEQAEMEYDTPDYKVFVGAFRTESEARTALAHLKQNPEYSGAFVRPKKITIYD